VAAAAHAVVAGVPLEAALVAAYYQGVSGFITAAMKLLRIGQNAAHGLLTEAMARCADSVRDARSVALEDAGSFTPVLDIASARHESAYSRIFIS
jgi:urease accessory protein